MLCLCFVLWYPFTQPDWPGDQGQWGQIPRWGVRAQQFFSTSPLFVTACTFSLCCASRTAKSANYPMSIHTSHCCCLSISCFSCSFNTMDTHAEPNPTPITSSITCFSEPPCFTPVFSNDILITSSITYEPWCFTTMFSMAMPITSSIPCFSYSLCLIVIFSNAMPSTSSIPYFSISSRMTECSSSILPSTTISPTFHRSSTTCPAFTGLTKASIQLL